MKTPTESQQPGQPGQPATRLHLQKRRGVALILVISFIVLLSALVIGFFSRVSTELSSARSYAEGVNVRQLADSAVAVVMGQIRNATTVKNGCWASQPGMIRVYRTAGGQAGPNAFGFYKLYSSHDLIVSTTEVSKWDPSQTNPSNSALPVEVPLGTGGWGQQPAFFTDLNQSVDVPDPAKDATPGATIKRYPIFDPSVAAIYEPNARPDRPKWVGLVEGAEVELSATDRKVNNAPMPVRWIYVLKDGTLTAPTQLTRPATGTQGLIATWPTTGTKTGVPTKDNPIVGRMGFWADDDSCKVNVNTAGGFVLPQGADDEDTASAKLGAKFYSTHSVSKDETNPAFYAGSFWDTPRLQTYFERGINNVDAKVYRGGLANSQPTQNEFQRYPGHPCTTSLGLVFMNLLPALRTGFDSEKLYAVTPRLMPGGSQNGTVRLDTKFDTPLSIKLSYLAGISSDPAGTRDLTKPDLWSFHLLGSVDEFFYTAMNGERRTAESAVNDWAASQKWTRTLAEKTITPTLLDKTRFFLTANSRSPELNLFGRPRVTMWPVPSATRELALQNFDPPIRNPKDDLIRFCSTVGDPKDPNRKGQFIFERQDPYSSTFDLMGPGKNGANWRNYAVFSYLKTLSGSPIPGFGGNFQTKYAGANGGFNQTLVEIFDYIRTVNQKDGSRDRRIDQATKPQSALNNQLKTAARYAPHALVVPTRVTIDGKPASGFGRYPTISEATLVFYHAGYVCVPKPGSELSKQDLPKGGSARVPGGENEVVIYDLDKTPWDLDPTDPTYTKLTKKAVENGALSSTDPKDWARNNVKEWKAQLIRAFLVFETFNPMQGYAPVDNFANVTMWDTTKIGSDGRMVRYGWADPTKGVFVHELRINKQFSMKSNGLIGDGSLGIGMGVSTNPLKNEFTRTSGETWAGRNFGGTEGIFHPIQDHVGMDPGASPSTTSYYAFQSPCVKPTDGIRVGLKDTTLSFLGGSADLFISYRDSVPFGHKESIQTVKLDFKASSTQWPMPTPRFRLDTGGFDGRREVNNTDKNDSWQRWSTYLADPLRGGWGMGYHLPSRIAWARQHSYAPWTKFDKYGKQVGDGYSYSNRFLQLLQPGDTIRSLIPGGDTPEGSDPRIAALQQTVTTLVEHPDYQTEKHRAETLRRADGGFYFDPGSTAYAEPSADSTKPTTGSFTNLNGNKYRSGFGPDLPRQRKAGSPFIATRTGGQAADFDTGLGSFPDGAFAGKADEGNVAEYWVDIWGNYNYVEPYFSTWLYDPPLDTYFSPNRQVPGPVMFGSLPAPQGPWASAGWKTLLFCPNPASVNAAGANHPGLDVTPPDHLILDMFNMPVVEPYAISEPFSSGGKVNLNYQLMPFVYIKRTTALRAALHPLRVTAIPQTFVDGNKQLRYKGQDNSENLRYLVDREQTLKGFEAFFAKFARDKSGGFFKSASQICERFLYPKGTTVDGSNVTYTTNDSQVREFWMKNQVTGDNLREKPYADLYPRITTKSNTFTVHYRVQTLRQRAYSGKSGSPAEATHYQQWNEADDQVLSELRGHTTIERYLDPEDPRFDPASTATNKINIETESLEDAYRFRIVANKRFLPW